MKKFIASSVVLALGVALLAGCEMCGDTPYDPAKQFCDTRDNHVYKFVTIGEQTWMAENLSYETSTGSYCYNDSTEYCQKYGRLYTWVAAIDKSEEKCGSGKNCNLGNGKVRGACPEGWHLPDTTEWLALVNAVGGYGTFPGGKLKYEEGWENMNDGTNKYGFSALPAGFRDYSSYKELDKFAFFWTSNEYDYVRAYYVYLPFNDSGVYIGHGFFKFYAQSVRCVKD